MSSQRRCPALFLVSACWLLQSATPFVATPCPGHRPAATSSSSRCKQSITDNARLRHATVLATAELDADVPGVSDSRLAGWRVRDTGAEGQNSDHVTSDVFDYGDMQDGGEPVCGDVVEYPLAALVKEEAADGREKGVAVIVSINKNRNDAWKLPEDILDLAELEVLCPDVDAEEDGIWISDELEACAFAHLGEMKVLKSTFNGAMDKWKRWKIEDELSQGCGARDAEWEYDVL